MIESEHMFNVVTLWKLLVAVVLLNHVLACVWYLIGLVRCQTMEASVASTAIFLKKIGSIWVEF